MPPEKARKVDASQRASEPAPASPADPGHEAADPGHEAADPGHEAANPGRQAANPGRQAANPGRQAANPGRQAADLAAQVKPRAGATRCPFCHEGCEAGGEVCVCGDCLSRHHVACWDEGGRCASCGGAQRLAPVERGQPPRQRTRKRGQPPRQRTRKRPKPRRPVYHDAIDGWLRMGAVYNGLLAALTLLVLGGSSLRFLPHVLFGAFFANLAFLLGPAIELTLRQLSFRDTTWVRWLLFVPGLLCALFMTLMICASLVHGPM